VAPRSRPQRSGRVAAGSGPARSERRPGLLGLLVATASLASGAPACRPAEPRLPDVVVVVVDTLRADRLPFLGYGRDTAPFLSSWAERSIVFENAWSTSSWTAPAMASVFTGVYPNQHGVVLGRNAFLRLSAEDPTMELNRIPDALETMPEMMRRLGYRTFGVADNPNLCAEEGFESGFDRFEGFDYEGAEAVNAVVERWREEIAAAEPSFVYLHYMDPHRPYHEREPWFEDPGDERAAREPFARPSEAYDSEIRYLDERIAQAFELLGVDERTVVVFAADHGEEFGDHGRGNHLFQLYSELTRVPLFVHHPGIEPRRRRVEGNVSLVDVLPTLRAILGEPPAEQDEGRALTESWLGEREPGVLGERTLFAMRTSPAGNRIRSAVRGGFKYVHTLPSNRRELYDLAADPGELRNLIDERADIAQRLQEALERFEAGARRWEASSTQVELTEEELRSLERLGYAGEGN